MGGVAGVVVSGEAWSVGVCPPVLCGFSQGPRPTGVGASLRSMPLLGLGLGHVLRLTALL